MVWIESIRLELYVDQIEKCIWRYCRIYNGRFEDDQSYNDDGLFLPSISMQWVLWVFRGGPKARCCLSLLTSIYIRIAQTYLSVCPERSQDSNQRQCIGFNPSTQTTLKHYHRVTGAGESESDIRNKLLINTN